MWPQAVLPVSHRSFLESVFLRNGCVSDEPAADKQLMTQLLDIGADSRLLQWITSHVAVPDPNQTVVSGPNLKHGVISTPASITVHVRDQFGQPTSAAAVKVTAELFSAASKRIVPPDFTKPMTWHGENAMPKDGSQIAVCASRDGKCAYLFGGIDRNAVMRTTVYLFDAEKKTYTEKAALPGANRGMGCCLLPDDTIMLAGGTRSRHLTLIRSGFECALCCASLVCARFQELPSVCTCMTRRKTRTAYPKQMSRTWVGALH
jgi:hypothetical protein